MVLNIIIANSAYSLPTYTTASIALLGTNATTPTLNHGLQKEPFPFLIQRKVTKLIGIGCKYATKFNCTVKIGIGIIHRYYGLIYEA